MVLGIPLLPLLAVFQLGDKSLSVGLIQLDNLLQLLHEEQLQHSLVRVQVSQLEELPLQNVVVYFEREEIKRQSNSVFLFTDEKL